MNTTSFALIGGHPALNFLNTVEGHGAAAVDRLPGYEHLLRWAEQAGLLTRAQATRVAEAHHPWLTEGAWTEALELRRALDAVFRAVASGTPPPERALAAFNATLAAALAHRRLSGGFAWDWGEAGDRLEIPSWTIALSAADLLSDPARRAQIKACGNHACGWLFLDATPSGRRRWCRMNVCGNAAKVRRFRAKQQRR